MSPPSPIVAGSERGRALLTPLPPLPAVAGPERGRVRPLSAPPDAASSEQERAPAQLPPPSLDTAGSERERALTPPPADAATAERERALTPPPQDAAVAERERALPPRPVAGLRADAPPFTPTLQAGDFTPPQRQLSPMPPPLADAADAEGGADLLTELARTLEELQRELGYGTVAAPVLTNERLASLLLAAAELEDPGESWEMGFY